MFFNGSALFVSIVVAAFALVSGILIALMGYKQYKKILNKKMDAVINDLSLGAESYMPHLFHQMEQK